jgi:hypothetical protein
VVEEDPRHQVAPTPHARLLEDGLGVVLRLRARRVTGRARSTACAGSLARPSRRIESSRRGREPQPGLALLRLAQVNTDAADAAIRRIAAETSDGDKRAGLLPSYDFSWICSSRTANALKISAISIA